MDQKVEEVGEEKMKKLEDEEMTKNEEDEDEEVMEMRKLRLQNNLMKQRLARLEDESSILTDELVSYEQCESEILQENSPELKNELLHLRQFNSDINRRLEEAYQTIRELTERGDGFEDKEVQVDDQPTIEHIHILQEEVLEARARDLDHTVVTKELKTRAHELDLANEKLKNTLPDHCLPGLQSELAEIQTREAEANQLLRDTRRKIKELNEEWEAYIAKQPHPSQEGPITCKEMQEQIMGAIIREADALAELKETRQRVMELETQSHVFGNQLRRQDEQLKKLHRICDSGPGTERRLQCDVRETQHKFKDFEAMFKEQAVLARLKEAEILETMADLKRQISEMESSYFEKWTQEELKRHEIHGQSFDDLDDIEELDYFDGSYHIGDDFEDAIPRITLTPKDSKKNRFEIPATSVNSAHG